jgi:RNA polymerase sigma factor (sigma-70 family)
VSFVISRAEIEQAYGSYYNDVFRFCLSRLSEADARDVTQDVFVLLQEKKASLKYSSSIKFWLMDVASKKIYEEYRAQKKNYYEELSEDDLTVESIEALFKENQYSDERIQMLKQRILATLKEDEFELYINLSGEVSFLVENTLYPVSRGDVIIARPGEQHHCFYRSGKPHKFFWILFDAKKNHQLLDFLKEGSGENFISPRGEMREELLELCRQLHVEELTAEEQIYSFLRIFSILKNSRAGKEAVRGNLPEDLQKIIEYINLHIFEDFTIADVARETFISQSTLERRFKQVLGTTPLEFIRRKKLMIAAQMLSAGESVLQAGAAVGYTDTSYFIELFKAYYGITPLQFKHHEQ